ncbi:hypothetical protein M885DRAFT_325224 [Pelagophyceae sp. CCMP2097]|nr:hypothetical protein M885DRAFT_325224 [Pelagophyceae sp. CCMP2097]
MRMLIVSSHFRLRQFLLCLSLRMANASKGRRYLTYSCRVATYISVVIVDACVFRHFINLHRVICLGRAHLFVGLYGQALGPGYRLNNGFFSAFPFLDTYVLPCALIYSFRQSNHRRAISFPICKLSTKSQGKPFIAK